MAAPTTLEQVAALAAALGIGGIASKLLDRWSAKAEEARREPADMTRAAAEFQNALTGGAKELIDHLVSETERLSARTDELQSKADAAKAAADEAKDAARALQQAHQRCEVELAAQRAVGADLQRQIDLLMSGPVASYGPRLPGGQT